MLIAASCYGTYPPANGYTVLDHTNLEHQAVWTYNCAFPPASIDSIVQKKDDHQNCPVLPFHRAMQLHVSKRAKVTSKQGLVCLTVFQKAASASYDDKSLLQDRFCSAPKASTLLPLALRPHNITQSTTYRRTKLTATIMSNNMSASASESVSGAPLPTGYGPASAAVATIILEVRFPLSFGR